MWTRNPLHLVPTSGLWVTHPHFLCVPEGLTTAPTSVPQQPLFSCRCQAPPASLAGSTWRTSWDPGAWDLAPRPGTEAQGPNHEASSLEKLQGQAGARPVAEVGEGGPSLSGPTQVGKPLPLGYLIRDGTAAVSDSGPCGLGPC